MSKIELLETLGLPSQEISAHSHNLWVGLSDNAWFNDIEKLKLLVGWAHEHTREKLLVVIPGRMYTTNYFHIDKMTRANALRRGFETADYLRQQINLIFAERINEISVVNYDDLLTPTFAKRREVFYRAFSEQGRFYDRIMEVAEQYLLTRRKVAPRLSEAIALYQLQELPMFIAPIRTVDSDTVFAAVVYPGTGLFDRLARDIVEGEYFPELTQQLNLTEPCGIVNVKLIP